MKNTLLLALALTAIGVNAQPARLLLVNAGTTVVQVQAEDRSIRATIQPGTAAEVTFYQPQWLRSGQKAYRYDTKPVQRLRRKGKEIVLQLEPNAGLYLMPAGTTAPGSKPPAQPKGFPIRPSRTFDMK